MKGQVYILKDVIQNPKKAFKTISKNGGAFLLGAIIIVVLPAIIKALFTVVTYGPITVEPSETSIVKNLLKDVMRWLILVACLHTVGNIIKGTIISNIIKGEQITDSIGLLSAIGYAKFPLIFSWLFGGYISSFIPEEVEKQLAESPSLIFTTPACIAVLLVTFAFVVWIFVLYTLATRESHEFSTWKAFCTTIIGWIVTFFLAPR